jgi:hypothetical protein
MPRKSETDSEKRTRGRPALLPKEYRGQLVNLWGPDKSPRTIQNRHYYAGACQLLGINDSSSDYRKRFPYLFPGKEGFKHTVLVELGRLAEIDPDGALALAEALNTAGLSARAATAKIRAHRLGRTAKADALTLANRLIDVVNEYVRTTDCDWPMAVQAVETAWEQVRKAAER